MKKIIIVLFVLTSIMANADDIQIANCVLSQGVLSVIAPASSSVGPQLFKWNISSVEASNLVGSYMGSSVMSYITPITYPKSFKAVISQSSFAGEVIIDIKDCDLTNNEGFIVPSNDEFSFRCNVIAQ